MDARAKQVDETAAAGGGAGFGREDGGPSDEQLVTKCMAGDRRSFDELIKRYQRQAVAVSYRLLGNSQDALEVTQDAFLKAYSSIKTLQKPGAFGGWLMRIVSNLSLNYRRSRKLRQQLPLDDCLGPTEAGAAEGGAGASEWMAKDDDPLHRVERPEMGAELKKALSQVPAEVKLSIIM